MSEPDDDDREQRLALAETEMQRLRQFLRRRGWHRVGDRMDPDRWIRFAVDGRVFYFDSDATHHSDDPGYRAFTVRLYHAVLRSPDDRWEKFDALRNDPFITTAGVAAMLSLIAKAEEEAPLPSWRLPESEPPQSVERIRHDLQQLGFKPAGGTSLNPAIVGQPLIYLVLHRGDIRFAEFKSGDRRGIWVSSTLGVPWEKRWYLRPSGDEIDEETTDIVGLIRHELEKSK